MRQDWNSDGGKALKGDQAAYPDSNATAGNGCHPKQQASTSAFRLF
jgi:hypothetical protein